MTDTLSIGPRPAARAEPGAIATARAIAAGELTARDACEQAIERIEQRDVTINAVVVRDFDRARAQADAADLRLAEGDRAPLLGVPMTVKESYDLIGLPTTWGHEEHRDYIPDDDALAVKRLKQAGAVILGKTNVPVALSDLQSVNPIYGRTNNPFSLERTCGGSSGGAAAALASGMIPLEMGSDIAGSIRVPAHFCGIWGHKSTFGLLPMEGHLLPRTDGSRPALSVIGPMARHPEDLALALDVVSDLPLPRTDVASLDGLRLLVLDHHPLAQVARSVRSTLGSLAQAAEAAGAIVNTETRLLPDLEAQHAGYMRLLLTTLSRGMAPEGMEPVTLSGWFDMMDDQARNLRAWRRLFTEFDAVVAPVLGTPAFAHDDALIAQRVLPIDGTGTPFGAQFAFPGLATYPGLPATAVPVATDTDGMPIGVQVLTDFRHDHRAIRIGTLLQECLP